MADVYSDLGYKLVPLPLTSGSESRPYRLKYERRSAGAHITFRTGANERTRCFGITLEQAIKMLVVLNVHLPTRVEIVAPCELATGYEGSAINFDSKSQR
jgi:hypothetical protein